MHPLPIVQARKLEKQDYLKISPYVRKLLNAFWKSRPDLRKACTDKYGYDPIQQEREYWPPGITEADHDDIRNDINNNGGIFSAALARRWIISETSK